MEDQSANQQPVQQPSQQIPEAPKTNNQNTKNLIAAGLVITTIIIVGACFLLIYGQQQTNQKGAVSNPYYTNLGYQGPGYYNVSGKDTYISSQGQLNSALNPTTTAISTKSTNPTIPATNSTPTTIHPTPITTVNSSTTTTPAATTTIHEPPPLSGAVSRPILFGQTNATEASPNTVSPFKMFHGAGIIVDTSSVPNKVYVVDSGNNRILGYDGIGYCAATTTPCTDDSDCIAQGSNAECIVNGTKAPDMVFGQPNFYTAACNGNDSIGVYGPASASSLCLTGYPELTNIAEYWQRINIAVDGSGNLYVVDLWNNRILKYDSPFSLNKTDGRGDNLPDMVLGQPNFTGHIRNRGNITFGPPAPPTNDTLWLDLGTEQNYKGWASSSGVSVDAHGNVWVADKYNSRVLRFPANSTVADLVIGQSNMTTIATGAGCIDNAPLNELCTPTLAMISPFNGDLYVLDEHPQDFQARILVFDPPFTNGMAASRVIIPKEPNGFVSYGGGNNPSYQFQATGFAFNPDRQGAYAQGVLWINENEYHRTILIDDQGNILDAINAPTIVNVSNWGDAFPPCGQSTSEGFNLAWPGGSIGFDSDNNIYLADATNNRISRYALPYTPITYPNGTVCMPATNGGLFPGTQDNTYTDPQRLGEQLGAAAYDNQLLVMDEQGLFVWNNYTKQQTGVPPSFIIQLPAGMGHDQMISGSIDEMGRLWLFNQNGELDVYQLPLQAGATPIVTDLNIYWNDYGVPEAQANVGGGTITFDTQHHQMYIANEGDNRILRISNYNEIFPHGDVGWNSTNLAIDMVIGQTTKNGTACNEGNPGPSSTTLCAPHQIKFDNSGNMFVIENDYECHGNDRIVVYSAQSLNAAYGYTLFPNIAATDVLIAPNLNSKGPCATVGYPGSPVSLAFDSRGSMVVGEDGYYGNEGEDQGQPDIVEIGQYMQLWLYQDPMAVNAIPNATIRVPMGSAGDLTFDSSDNLIAQDHTWNRLWVVNFGAATPAF